MRSLDGYDKKLLKQLQKNNRFTAEELGKLVNLSASAVQRRLQRLRTEKIIEADVSVVSPSAVGLAVTCIVDVSLHLGNSRSIESFKKLMSSCGEVMQCYYVAGAWDFVVVLAVSDMQHFERFYKKYLMNNSEVKQFYSHIVLEKAKESHQLSF